ncbi:MAG: efflux RND transporter periplasmic adaptor subunit [Pseudomonadota bacterium]
MRFFSIVTAIVVMAVLYFVVFERDRLFEFAGRSDEAPAEAVPASEAVGAASAAPAPASNDGVPVVAVRSDARVIDSAVLLRGRTEAARQVDVRAETSGLVISDPIRKGASVDEGALLCTLDPGTREIALEEAEARLDEAAARLPESQARLAEAEAMLAEAEINDRAAARLSQDGFASETRVAATQAAVESARAGVESAKSSVQSANAGIRSAEASVASAKKDIERLEIHAPFAGLLESDTAEIGTLLQPGALCATVIALDPIKVVGFVPETSVDRVTVGALAGARLASGREVQGNVIFLSRASDPETRTFRVEIEVGNADLTIRDGQTAEIAIASDGAEAHLVPASALTLDDDGNLGVRTVTDEGTARFSPVTVLRDTTEGVWVGGLPATIALITVGQEFVTDGVPVDPTFREAAE